MLVMYGWCTYYESHSQSDASSRQSDASHSLPFLFWGDTNCFMIGLIESILCTNF